MVKVGTTFCSEIDTTSLEVPLLPTLDLIILFISILMLHRLVQVYL